MAKTPKPTPTPEPEIAVPAPVAEDTIVEYPRNLDKLLTAASQNNRLGIEIKDQLSAILRDRHAAIETFIDEQIAGGLSLDVVMAFSTIETPLLPTTTTTAGRVKVTWPFHISIDDEK